MAVLAVLGAAAAIAITTLTGSSGGGREAGSNAAGNGGGGAGAKPGVATTSYPADWKPYTGPVPILEYHAIQPPPAGSPYPQLFVPQADFVAQVKWLAEHGYEGVTLDRVEDAWYKGGELPPKPVVITFDDGYLSQFVAAFPALEHFHWPGVLNLVAKGSDLPDADVQKMLDAKPGWELASHTVNHVDLTTLGSAELEREVSGSRKMLQDRFGVPVDNFCYPLGNYDNAVIAAVKAAGYRGATGEVPGLATAAHPYILNRIEILFDAGLRGFVSKLKAAEAGSPDTSVSPGG